MLYIWIPPSMTNEGIVQVIAGQPHRKVPRAMPKVFPESGLVGPATFLVNVVPGRHTLYWLIFDDFGQYPKSGGRGQLTIECAPYTDPP